MKRPLPPPDMAQYGSPAFLPADGMDEFVRATFLDQDSPLFIPEHEILAQATFGYLWAAPEAKDRNRMIVGTAQLMRPPQKKWTSLRALFQVEQWFGDIDFLITLSVPYVTASHVTEAEVLALIDHELCHCCQDERDGAPLFRQDTGEPIWGMRSHDVEQFIGPVRRWGAGPAGVTELVSAAQQPPLFGEVDIRSVVEGCGTCLRAA
jgi:hypothetical protein